MKQENIFEGAKFRSMFITERGSKLCYLGTDMYSFEEYPFFIEEGNAKIIFSYWDGQLCDSNDKIVARYQEPIDKNKLEELAQQSCDDYMYTHEYLAKDWDLFFNNGFTAGYTKAMEE